MLNTIKSIRIQFATSLVPLIAACSDSSENISKNNDIAELKCDFHSYENRIEALKSLNASHTEYFAQKISSEKASGAIRRNEKILNNHLTRLSYHKQKIETSAAIEQGDLSVYKSELKDDLKQIHLDMSAIRYEFDEHISSKSN
jgi:hypothetical protein